MELIWDTQRRSKLVNVGAAAISLDILYGFQENVSVKSRGSRVCLGGIFQSGSSEDVVQLLEDCSPGGSRSYVHVFMLFSSRYMYEVSVDLQVFGLTVHNIGSVSKDQ